MKSGAPHSLSLTGPHREREFATEMKSEDYRSRKSCKQLGFLSNRYEQESLAYQPCLHELYVLEAEGLG